MCGICGYVGLGVPEDLKRMTDALAHRGPDGQGSWQDSANRVFLGHRRLSIVDLEGGAQPMATDDGALVIVFNGEIYNHPELRKQLEARGHRFRTDHSDTEVLLYGFREWGRDLPGHLNGMWAFVIYDRPNRLLFASRDRFGEKPFFYSHRNGTFAFGSELGALRVHSTVGRDLSLSTKALFKYFGYGYIPAPHSIFEGVYKLPAAHSLLFDLRHAAPRPEVSRYWRFQIEPFEERPAEPERVWGEQLIALLDQAVQRRLLADVPVGVFLSGGVDSSAITALASRHVPPGSLETFTIGFEEPSFDESAFARTIAERFKTQHHEERLSMEAASALLPEIGRRLDEPMGDSSVLPTYLLSRFARQRVKVALGGDGGDELFAGYDPFRALRRAEQYQKFVPKPVHHAIAACAARLPVSHRNMSWDFKLKRTLRGLAHPSRLWLPWWMAPVTPDELGALFGAVVDQEDLYSEAIEAWDACRQTNLIDRTMQFYVELYLQDDILVKVDRASMMHGLESRAPFLDIEFVDFVRRLPAEWKFRHGSTKYLLKKSLEKLLPAEILHRPKKGFGVPIGQWFKQGTLSVGDTHVINSPYTAQKLREHRAGAADHRAFLWNAWLLETWHSARAR